MFDGTGTEYCLHLRNLEYSKIMKNVRNKNSFIHAFLCNERTSSHQQDEFFDLFLIYKVCRSKYDISLTVIYQSCKDSLTEILRYNFTFLLYSSDPKIQSNVERELISTYKGISSCQRYSMVLHE